MSRRLIAAAIAALFAPLILLGGGSLAQVATPVDSKQVSFSDRVRGVLKTSGLDAELQQGKDGTQSFSIKPDDLPTVLTLRECAPARHICGWISLSATFERAEIPAIDASNLEKFGNWPFVRLYVDVNARRLGASLDVGVLDDNVEFAVLTALQTWRQITGFLTRGIVLDRPPANKLFPVEFQRTLAPLQWLTQDLSPDDRNKLRPLNFDELRRMIEQENLVIVDTKSVPAGDIIFIESNGIRVAATLGLCGHAGASQKCDELILATIFPEGMRVTPAVVNAWNLKYSFVRASLGPEGRVGLAISAPVFGGISRTVFRQYIDKIVEVVPYRRAMAAITSIAPAAPTSPSDQLTDAQGAQQQAASETEPENGPTYLTDDQILSRFRGNSSDGFMVSSGPYREFYARSGEIRGRRVRGTWWVEDDRFCARYPGSQTACYRIRLLDEDAFAWVLGDRAVGYGRTLTGNHYRY